MQPIFQRITSIILYTLPLKASLPFGNYLFYKYSFLKDVLNFLTLPVSIIESSLPFGGLLLFLILYAGLVRNPNVPYFVRYNCCQSILLDVGLIIIFYVLGIISKLGSLIPITFFISATFLITLIIFIFSVFQCSFGAEPEIPFISRSVRMQI